MTVSCWPGRKQARRPPHVPPKSVEPNGIDVRGGEMMFNCGVQKARDVVIHYRPSTIAGVFGEVTGIEYKIGRGLLICVGHPADRGGRSQIIPVRRFQ